jgi:hypothetical protein
VFAQGLVPGKTSAPIVLTAKTPLLILLMGVMMLLYLPSLPVILAMVVPMKAIREIQNGLDQVLSMNL